MLLLLLSVLIVIVDACNALLLLQNVLNADCLFNYFISFYVDVQMDFLIH